MILVGVLVDLLLRDKDLLKCDFNIEGDIAAAVWTSLASDFARYWKRYASHLDLSEQCRTSAELRGHMPDICRRCQLSAPLTLYSLLASWRQTKSTLATADQFMAIATLRTLSTGQIEMSTNARHEKEIRQNCWSPMEDMVLTGAVVERFLTFGSLISQRTKDSNMTQVECWQSIGRAYRDAWVSLCARLTLKPTPGRSNEAVRRHFKVLRSKRQGFKVLYEKWRSHKFEPERRRLCLLHNKRDIDRLKDQLRDLEKRKSRTGKRCDAWSKREEVILFGCVVERFLKYGSLSSARFKPLNSEDVELDIGIAIKVWAAIKAMFDLVVDASSRHENEKGEPTDEESVRTRTMHALCRRFKVIKARQIDRPTELAAFYDEWREMLESNTNLREKVKEKLYPLIHESSSATSCATKSVVTHSPLQLTQRILDWQRVIERKVCNGFDTLV